MTTHPSTTTVTLLRPEQVAEQANVSPPTVYRWLQTGQITPAYQTVGGEPLFSQEQAWAIAAWRVEQVTLRQMAKEPA